MFQQFSGMAATTLFLMLIVASASGRSANYDTSQVNGDSDVSASANVIDSSGLTPLQLEILTQRLAEYNNQMPAYPINWDRLIRGPEMKRQSRYRQCYFNPVSCFKK